jgi:hypothetical protein
MTHAELTAALKGDYRSDSAAERHNSYAIRRPVAQVTDPRNVSRPADWPRVWR